MAVQEKPEAQTILLRGQLIPVGVAVAPEEQYT